MKHGFSFRALAVCLAMGGAAQAQTWQGNIGANFVAAQDGAWWGRAVTAEGDFLRWLGAARLQTAQAAYWQAQAAGQWQRAHAIQSAVAAMQNDLSRANRHITGLNRNLGKIDEYVRRLNGFISGNVSTSGMIATRALLAMLPPAVIKDLLAEGALVPAFAASDFTPMYPMQTTVNPETGERETRAIVLEDFPGGNIFALVAWLSKYPLKAIMGSPGHTAVLLMRNVVLGGAETWYNRITEQRNNFEDRYQDIWQPVVVGEFSYPERRLP